MSDPWCVTFEQLVHSNRTGIWNTPVIHTYYVNEKAKNPVSFVIKMNVQFNKQGRCSRSYGRTSHVSTFTEYLHCTDDKIALKTGSYTMWYHGKEGGIFYDYIHGTNYLKYKKFDTCMCDLKKHIHSLEYTIIHDPTVFLMGLHKRAGAKSSISRCFNSELGDKNILLLIKGFW